MVFVATAAKGLAEEAIRSTRPGAKIMLFAQTSDKERIELSGASICVGERSLLGSYSASVELQAESARLVFSGELPVNLLISHRVPLDKIEFVDLEKTLLRKVGDAIHRLKMIRDGDRIAVAVSGGKDSVTLLEALILLQKRAPIDFSIKAFTVEQGKFLAPVEAVGEHIRSLGIDWTYHTDNPSIRLLTEQPGHGCDICSRFRRRAVYQIARGMNCNVIAFGHTADDFCESLLRNMMYTGRLSALPAVT